MPSEAEPESIVYLQNPEEGTAEALGSKIDLVVTTRTLPSAGTGCNGGSTESNVGRSWDVVFTGLVQSLLADWRRRKQLQHIRATM